MFIHLPTALRRRPARIEPSAVADRRGGAPDRRRPEPMPRMRWYR